MGRNEAAGVLRLRTYGAPLRMTPLLLALRCVIEGARLPQPAQPSDIAVRLERLPPTRTIWKLVVLLSFGFFFELYDLLYTGYIAPGIVKSKILTTTTAHFFGMTGIAAFIAALFAGLFLGTIACGFLA